MATGPGPVAINSSAEKKGCLAKAWWAPCYVEPRSRPGHRMLTAQLFVWHVTTVRVHGARGFGAALSVIGWRGRQ